MFYLTLLLVLSLLVGAIFAAPLRGKVWVAFTAVAIAAIAVGGVDMLLTTLVDLLLNRL